MLIRIHKDQQGELGNVFEMESTQGGGMYLNVEKELDLYYKNYYGSAATMKAYHETLEDAAINGSFIRNRCSYIMPLFQQPLVDKMDALMQKAQAEVTGQPVCEKRIYGVWAGYEYVRLLRKMLDLTNKNRLDETLAARDEFWKFYSSFKDDSQWGNNMKATMWWEDQGYHRYDGVAWYRRKLSKPQTKPGRKVMCISAPWTAPLTCG